MRPTDLKCITGVNWNPTCIPTNIIYQGITTGSPARRLLVDIHASWARNDWYPKDVDLDPAFLMELLRKLLHYVATYKTVKESRQLDLKAEDYCV